MFEKFDSYEKNITNSQAAEKNLHRNFRPDNIESSASVLKQTDSSKGTWVETGIKNVPVDKIDTSDSYVKGPDDFKKVSHDDMVKGFQTLETKVRPQVENGANVDNFRAQDQAKGLDYPNGSQKVYEAFYGSEPIKLDKVGDSYKVVNGYHRLYVAQELGVTTVPARVSEKI